MPKQKNKKTLQPAKTKKKDTQKKNQSLKRKEANDRKLQADQLLSEIGLQLSDDIYSIGILFDDLNISHLTYVALNDINKICDQYSGLDIYIFVEQLLRPCVHPKCGIGTIKEVFGWKEPLLTTSINTCIYALNSSSDNIYYYVFDVDFLNNYYFDWKTIKKAFCDPRVTIFVRHEDHKNLIEDEFGIKVVDIIIRDFDLKVMAKFIIEDKKNGKQISHKT